MGFYKYLRESPSFPSSLPPHPHSTITTFTKPSPSPTSTTTKSTATAPSTVTITNQYNSELYQALLHNGRLNHPSANRSSSSPPPSRSLSNSSPSQAPSRPEALAKISPLGENPPKAFKISPSTDPPRFAQENPPGWHPQSTSPPQSPLPTTTSDDPSALFPTFNSDFELFGPSDQTPATSARLSSTVIPDHSVASVNDAVFNLGYTTSLPTTRNWSAPQRSSPFVNSSAPEPNPALIEALSDTHRQNLIRGNFLPPIDQIILHQSNSLEPVLQRDIEMLLHNSPPPSPTSSSSSSSLPSTILNSPPAEFTRRQKNMEDELLSLAGLEASPLHANDMTFSPNNPLFHDFSPFIGTIPYTGRTNETLDDSTDLDTPLFGVEDAVLDDWTPLFSSEEQFNFSNPAPAVVPMEHTPSTDGTLINPAALMLNGESESPLTAVIPSRQLSTDSNKSRAPSSPSTKSAVKGMSAKRASLSGVNRRKAALELPPVQYDPSNPVDIKRARNTMAARKSRARRVEKMEELSITVDKLQAEAQSLKEEKEYYKNLARQHGALVD
ncbi:hypothetical protein DRE_01362 [Drechslerella stenobrocha 248]|uniref:BZIP domain-containing protein n=1 Tax=Drechslerella stenobrocha 248 TaxID=1043628 RepID=W7I5J9_9PEZI|nr:hypothetical protein DRE_01362 [Drechslerella stenobrocha 248]